MIDNAFFPALFIMFSVILASYVLLDLVSYISQRYKERYLEETSLELDDVLLQLPPGRILDLNLAFSIFLAITVTTIVALRMDDPDIWVILLIGSILFLVSFPLPRLILRWVRKRRLRKFNEQLEEVLGSISSALKAGFSINQAFEEIANSNRHPISVEFRLLVQEIRLGVSMEQALDNMNRRIGSDDFELVATAVITARQTGGELTSALERLASLIRERMKINNKLMSMTAMGRLQALMIGMMPFLLLWGMYYVSPGMVGAFFSTPIGYIVLCFVVLLDVIGFLIIRKITSIDI